ncbi:hypothetical protein FQN60_017638 [Etheostoma spectabile]|uniref:Uncharacterized protein n=1 Tax=Etheostoma spectabile TaxID=54343 RepID=A0A5J5D8Y7_9PERO|nr:hypothetical protein FQN60_013229 [Etheostoma spectabile]KAA8592183.1 hypothetical protein FQN60_017638 [Etheostoma spectabile]
MTQNPGEDEDFTTRHVLLLLLMLREKTGHLDDLSTMSIDIQTVG